MRGVIYARYSEGPRPKDIPKKPTRLGMPVKRYREMKEDIEWAPRY